MASNELKIVDEVNSMDMLMQKTAAPTGVPVPTPAPRRSLGDFLEFFFLASRSRPDGGCGEGEQCESKSIFGVVDVPLYISVDTSTPAPCREYHVLNGIAAFVIRTNGHDAFKLQLMLDLSIFVACLRSSRPCLWPLTGVISNREQWQFLLHKMC